MVNTFLSSCTHCRQANKTTPHVSPVPYAGVECVLRVCKLLNVMSITVCRPSKCFLCIQQSIDVLRVVNAFLWTIAEWTFYDDELHVRVVNGICTQNLNQIFVRMSWCRVVNTCPTNCFASSNHRISFVHHFSGARISRIRSGLVIYHSGSPF